MSFFKSKWILISVISAIFFSSALIVLMVFPFIYESEVAKRTNFVENTFLFPIWRDLPVPIYLRVYFFNVTNSEDFLKNGSKMQVDEVGPYTYVGRWIKEDLKWFAEGTVSYRERKTYHFVPEESVGSESDEIYTLNAPYVIASDVLYEAGPGVTKTADKILEFVSESLIIKKTIGELTFGGFKDPIMRYSKYIRWDSPFRTGTFAWLYGRNATDDGTFDVFTGEMDHSRLNMVDRWNGDKNLDFWKDDYCNMINGTNGEFGPPLRVDQTEYTFFQPIFCRSITLQYGGIENHKGIETRRFENKESVFSKENPDNYCFEVDEDLKSGVLDISPCQFGAPVVLSFPHFYLADPSYSENVDGLRPSKEMHGSHIDVEPVSGVTVDLSIKFQMNLKVKPVRDMSAFQNASSGVYPVFWLDLFVELPDELIDTINYQLFRPRRIVHVSMMMVMMLSLLCFILPVFKRETTEVKERIPLIKRNSPNVSSSTESSKVTYSGAWHYYLTSTPESSSELFTSFKNFEKSGSFTTGISGSSGRNAYNSFSEEESDADDDKLVEVERTKLFKKRSFKEARVLTVV